MNGGWMGEDKKLLTLTIYLYALFKLHHCPCYLAMQSNNIRSFMTLSSQFCIFNYNYNNISEGVKRKGPLAFIVLLYRLAENRKSRALQYFPSVFIYFYFYFQQPKIWITN